MKGVCPSDYVEIKENFQEVQKSSLQPIINTTDNIHTTKINTTRNNTTNRINTTKLVNNHNNHKRKLATKSK
jgi:hypothetical protein